MSEDEEKHREEVLRILEMSKEDRDKFLADDLAEMRRKSREVLAAKAKELGMPELLGKDGKMTLFDVVGINPSGEVDLTEVEADTDEDAQRIARSRGWKIHFCVPADAEMKAIEAELSFYRAKQEGLRQEMDDYIESLRPAGPVSETERAMVDELHTEIRIYKELLAEMKKESPSRKMNPWTVLVGILMVAGLAYAFWQPADRIYIEDGGKIYLLRPTWWGVNHETFPMRLSGSEWQVQEKDGAWIKYESSLRSDEVPESPRL